MRSRPIVLLIGAAALLVTSAASAAQSKSRKARAEARSAAAQSAQVRRTPDIYVGGRNMGTDPDPRVRAFIQRDWGAAFPGPD